MDTSTLDLLTEPAGPAYGGLLDFAATCCPRALLVVRPETELGAAGLEVLAALKPFLEQAVKADRWPGTQLFGDEAELFHFRLEPGSVEVLKAATDHLYGWLHPDLPEDLCFFRPDGEVWMATIAHEEDGFFVLSDWERRRLLQAVPGLKLGGG